MPQLKKTTKYGPSKTIPGQSLYPSDLMKRHLAGTLPPIDLSKQYEYHYNEDGEKIADRLPTEMYEVHALAVALRKKQYEAALEFRKQQAQKERDEIIRQYNEDKARESNTPPPAEAAQVPPPKTPATPSGARAKKTG